MTVLTAAVTAGALYPWDNLGKAGKFQDPRLCETYNYIYEACVLDKYTCVE